MKTFNITVIALRLYALLLFFDGVQGFYRLFFTWYYPLNQDGVLERAVFVDGMASMVFCLTAAAVLMRFSERIAAWIIPANTGEDLIQVDSSSLLRITLGLAGAIFLVRGLQQLGYSYSRWYSLPSDSMSYFGPEHKAGIVEACIAIVAGLMMFAGKERMAGFLRHHPLSGGATTPKPDGEAAQAENPKEETVHKDPYRVCVVVDPFYGMYLRGLPADEPLWVVDSAKNHPVIDDLRKERYRLNRPEEITTFKYDPESNPEDSLIAELPTIDLHHGGYSHDPPYAVLEVIGVGWSHEIKETLKGYGFVKYERTAEGFIAQRVVGR